MIDLLNTLACDNLSTKMRDGFRVFTYCQLTCEIKRTRKKVFKVTFFFLLDDGFKIRLSIF